MWTATFNGANSNDIGYAAAIDPATDEILIGGDEWEVGQSTNAFVRKFDVDGSVLWTQTYNNENSADAVYGLAVDDSGDVVAAGSSWAAGVSHDMWLRKHDLDGATVWTQTWNGVASSEDRARGVAIDSQGAIVVSGHSWVAGQVDDVVMLKYDENGTVMWTDTHNGSANNVDRGYGVALTLADQILFAGSEAIAGQGSNAWIRQMTP
jgi:hypothetical protein